jgi:Protein of unknown function (DUF2505)
MTRVFSAPMEFDLRHHFDAPTTVVADAVLDRGYQESLDGIGPLKSRTLLSQDEVDGVVVRKVRCVLDASFAGPAKAILGNSDPAWIEESTWAPERMEWQWTIVPEVAASILSARGVMALSPDGEGTARKVAGDVDVNFPFIGGKVESAIVAGVTKVYDEEAERLALWLNQHPS